MTAKEALRDFFDDMSEEDALGWLSLKDSSLVDWLKNESPSVTAAELLQFPMILRHLVLRYSAQFYTAEDAAFDVAENEIWEPASTEALAHIDD